MTIFAAKKALVAVIEGTTPLKSKLLAPRFVHDARGQLESVTGNRRFWLRTLGGAGNAPASTMLYRLSADLELVVDYATGPSADDLDSAIVDDWTCIAVALGDARKWHGSESGLIYVGAGPDDGPDAPLFPFSIDDVDGARRLRVRIPIQFKKVVRS